MCGDGDNAECFELEIEEVEVGKNGADVGARYGINWSSGDFLL